MRKDKVYELIRNNTLLLNFGNRTLLIAEIKLL